MLRTPRLRPALVLGATIVFVLGIRPPDVVKRATAHETGARSAAAGYRVRVGERLTNGAAGGRPILNLVAGIDNGAGGPAAVPTGKLEFVVDRRQFDSAALDRLPSTPPGTRLGWLAVQTSAVQYTLTFAGADRDPATGEPLVRTAFAVPEEYAPIAGATSWPGPVLRLGRADVTLSLDWQGVVQRFHAAGLDVVQSSFQIYLLGRYTHNRSRRTTMSLGVSAWPCADLACTALGPAATNGLTLSLPRSVTIRAPRAALYGQDATFSGTGRPGDFVHLTRVRPAGGQPVCTPTTVGSAQPCSPPWAPIYDRLAPTAKVGRDGRWSLSVALRTDLRPTLLGGAHDATGRYAVVEYTGTKPWGTPTYNGGAFSVITAAEETTRVTLDRPRLTVRPSGSRLAVKVLERGGDPNVKVRVTAGGRTLAAGALDDTGVFRSNLPAKRAAGRVQAHVSVPGAGSANGSVRSRR
jgi:hypothetical protein